MKVGDLVETAIDSPSRSKIGFITSIQNRHNDGKLWYFVRFPERGDGYWYHPSKLKVISESR